MNQLAQIERPVNTVRAIAFYLPQFHPIPENDEWWGKGFTDWANVAKAKPLFKGHYQPHLPADLGFYDLRLPEVREAQANLAREYGIHGFCYYHYWFNGRRLLERPVNEILASGQPDFPFCLCWANENWTRRWDGLEKDILLAQNYCDEDDLKHIRWLAGVFRDPRYIRVNERPLFMVYRLSKLPNPARTLELWRNEARHLGIGDIFICNVEGLKSEENMVGKCGLDGAVEFAPDWNRLPPPKNSPRNWRERLLGNHTRIHRLCAELGLVKPRQPENLPIRSYLGLVASMLAKDHPPYLRFPCVTPSWDNTARSAYLILEGSTPLIYQQWLEKV